MFRFTKTAPLVVALVVVILLGMVQPAAADFKMRLSVDGGKTWASITDVDKDGFIEYSGTLGNFSIVVTTGISKPAIGDPYTASMDLTSVAVTAKKTGGG